MGKRNAISLPPAALMMTMMHGEENLTEGVGEMLSEWNWHRMLVLVVRLICGRSF